MENTEAQENWRCNITECTTTDKELWSGHGEYGGPGNWRSNITECTTTDKELWSGHGEYGGPGNWRSNITECTTKDKEHIEWSWRIRRPRKTGVAT